MMRVLMLNYEYPPIGGGAGNATAYLMPQLAALGIKVDLVTSALGSQAELHTPAPGLRILRLPVAGAGHSYQESRALIGYTAAVAIRLPMLLKHGHYDLAHAFFAIPTGFLSYLTRRRMPYIISLRGSDVPGFSARFDRLHQLLRPLNRQIWSQAAALIANSVGLRELALRSFPDLAIDVIPNGVDTVTFCPLPKHTDQVRTRILCIARLIPRKGIADLLQAMAVLRSQGRAVELVVVGDGPLAKELKVQAEELTIAPDIHWMGHREHDQLPPIYAEANIYVQPSLHEGMSNTTLEALASGLPLVLSDTGGSAELVQGNGIVVSPGDVAALTAALTRLLDDPELCEAMGERSRALALEKSWRSVAEGYVEHYRAVVDQS